MGTLKRFAAALKGGLSALSPNCREAVRLQSDALDRPLSVPHRFGLRLHLLLCKWCRRYGRQISFLREAVHEHPDEFHQAAPRPLRPEARERMKKLLRGDPP